MRFPASRSKRARHNVRETRADQEVLAEAQDMLHQYGLKDWQVVFDHGRIRLGSCDYHKRRISLSRYFVRNNAASDIKETILHEIAHALVGPGHGHGPVWQRQAQALGIPTRASARHVQMPEPPWNLVCKGCGQIVARRHRRRMDIRRYACRDCLGGLEWVANQ